jgi:hypothetical protein
MCPQRNITVDERVEALVVRMGPNVQYVLVERVRTVLTLEAQGNSQLPRAERVQSPTATNHRAQAPSWRPPSSSCPTSAYASCRHSWPSPRCVIPLRRCAALSSRLTAAQLRVLDLSNNRIVTLNEQARAAGPPPARS